MESILGLLLDLYEGEQNRYGEIEYRVSEMERMIRIGEVASLLEKRCELGERESRLVGQCIDWGLNDVRGIVDRYLECFVPLAHLPEVREGFRARLSSTLVLESRLRSGIATLRDIRRLGLPREAWVDLAREAILEWTEEDRGHPDTLVFLALLKDSSESTPG